MSAPPNFDPHPMGRDTQPAPAPPRYLKHQIYADPRVFKHIDDHAINVSDPLFFPSKFH